jgi:DNA repair protein RecN (Recombination protein N)
MLQELIIRNFAIIDDLHIRFGEGLNILTGETGAGKSIIIDALGLLLGDRGASEWVRAGCELAQIEAAFHLPPESDIAGHVLPTLEEQGLDDPDSPHWLTLFREVRINGRNVCRVNGRTVNLQLLSEIAGHLIDVHGQGEHLNLLQPRTHIQLLDRYAGQMELRGQVGRYVGRLRQVRAELQRMRQDARTLAQRVDLLSFQAEEIFAARLRPKEDEELDSERRRLSNAETLMQLANAAQTVLAVSESEMPAALDLVGEAAGRLERLARVDPDMQPVADEAQGLLEQLSDLVRTIQDYADQVEFNPERLQEVEERVELIASLKRKYGDTIEQVIVFGEQAQAELDNIGSWEVKTAELEAQEEKLLRTIGKLSADLSSRRKEAGEQLARSIERELADLRMARARFGVQLLQSERPDGAYLPDGRRVAFDATGVDQVEFMISANPGEPLKPMAKVAPGGETARLMLALKSVLAHADATPTLIFDEIDQGIGGRVGTIVGEKLWNLTGQSLQANGTDTAPLANHQVLCITHLPQLAAFGDKHFTVNKQVQVVDGAERTSTLVRDLDAQARIEELVAMLGATTDAGRQSVEEMLSEALKLKQAGHKNEFTDRDPAK